MPDALHPTAAPRAGIGAFADVLRRPGVGAVTAIGMAARIPATAVGVTLTLHTVMTLGHGFAAAGLVAAAVPTGMAIGGPLLGSVIDRYGLRPVLLLTMTAGVAFWSVAPLLGYAGLLLTAFVAGVLTLPVFSLVRQVIAAIVPAGHRRPAFALDSMSVEISYMTGPAIGSLLTLWLGSAVTMRVIGAGFVLAGLALWWRDPPVRSDGRSPGAERRPPVRSWLTRPLLGALLTVTAAVLAIMGTEFAFIAALTEADQVWAIAIVNAVWCLASLVGGFVYGAARRTLPLPLLLAVLGVATLPAALAWSWWSLLFLLIPAGLVTAPTLAAGSDAIGGLAPDRVRGLVTGLQGSATTIGIAIAGPLAGFLVDVASPAVAIVVCGSVATVLAGIAAVLMREGRAAPDGRPGVAQAGA
ncbi:MULTISPECIES: MFS transporter [Pseudonocardia]|uniref:Major Facilitator Superfamily protein n=2 Tax=Pseudonocardia TaxID=1847 RepID=A0A1Y2MWB4_PSEAH|nr:MULTISPECIES: MFS transporter [Pseudonocardia]OSY39486.1 Major Facilitator Superfamily protein [Pseudonocardia autotrophica]TDN75276.1 putative MFS family arabinose efflux permease [Pseudonocardia autotrophica]BBF99222.1 MFS transporter [Pseudonocardia autotrophica]GEC24768.1 MFS transporter [Pseudonocardia saturnea]